MADVGLEAVALVQAGDQRPDRVRADLGHPVALTADQVHVVGVGSQVQQTARGVNISTIYRTLELLEQIGMVSHTHLHHGAPTYHLATDADHVHLVCRDCGRVTQIGPDAIRPLITALDERHGFETDVGHLTVFGRCAECRAAADG